MKQPSLIPYGEGAVLVKYATPVYDAKIVTHIQTLAENLRQSELWAEIVPAYSSLLLSYNPATLKFQAAISAIEKALAGLPPAKKGRAKSKRNVIEIPVVYGGVYGPDMDLICQSSGLTPKAIIALHSGEPYKVCMLGFIPGFTFLSQAPMKLHHPRRETPRALVPAGSVGIGGWQTGIYGLESPGGWQIIGRTPISLFDPARKDPFYLKPGDYIRFVPTSASKLSMAEPEDSLS